MRTILISILLLALAGCTSQKSAENGSATAESATTSTKSAPSTESASDVTEPTFGNPVLPGTDMYEGELKKALFAGGCFWCMEPPFDKVEGVKATVSGYAGGSEENPKYKEVAGGKTSHTEVVLVLYDPDQVKYQKLLDVFWRNHDPTDPSGQFVDRGSQYRPAVFYYNDEQMLAAKASAQELEQSGRFDEPIATEITEATKFWPAEEYHQNFYEKDPTHYKRYRNGSGRDRFLQRVWGD